MDLEKLKIEFIKKYEKNEKTKKSLMFFYPLPLFYFVGSIFMPILFFLFFYIVTNQEISSEAQAANSNFLMAFIGISPLLYIITIYPGLLIFKQMKKAIASEKNRIRLLFIHSMFFLPLIALIKENYFLMYNLFNPDTILYFEITMIFLAVVFYCCILIYSNKIVNEDYLNRKNFLISIEQFFIENIKTKDDVLIISKMKNGDFHENLIYKHYIAIQKKNLTINIDEILEKKYCRNNNVLFND